VTLQKSISNALRAVREMKTDGLLPRHTKVHRIRKGQFDLTAAHLKDTSAPSIWMTVLSAR